MLPCVSLGGHWGSQELAETFRNFPEAFEGSFVYVSSVPSDAMLGEYAGVLKEKQEGRVLSIGKLKLQVKTLCMKGLRSLVEYKYLQTFLLSFPLEQYCLAAWV